MEIGKRKQALIQAAIVEAVDTSTPKNMNMHHVQILMLSDIRDVLIEQNNLLREQLGKDSFPEKDPLPEPQHRNGRRFWVWPSKSKK